MTKNLENFCELNKRPEYKNLLHDVICSRFKKNKTTRGEHGRGSIVVSAGSQFQNSSVRSCFSWLKFFILPMVIFLFVFINYCLIMKLLGLKNLPRKLQTNCASYFYLYLGLI